MLAGFLVDKLFGLFASPPTKGTQIRQSVEKWLKDIGVSFASAIGEKNYFFGETNELAKKLFGNRDADAFLAASKQILQEKVGPELAKQAQALGTFITADLALDKGKPVEQTATTFGNLIKAGLQKAGKDSQKDFQDALSEIVAKGQISLEGVTGKLSEVFKKGAISKEFYRDAIQGAVSLFSHDLPAAINVSAIALQSFSEDGIFSLEKFTARVQDATTLFQGIGQAAIDALLSPLADADALKQFDDALKHIERELLTSRFLEGFQKQLFEGVDLSDGLGADEAEKLRARLAAGRQELHALLKAAGVLPGPFSFSSLFIGMWCEAARELLENTGCFAAWKAGFFARRHFARKPTSFAKRLLLLPPIGCSCKFPGDSGT